MLPGKKVYQDFDLMTLNLLPQGWLEQIISVAEQHAQYTQLDGRSSTSREPEGIEPVEVFVVMGNIIQAALPWLYKLYQNELRDLASQAAGQLVYPSIDLPSAININVLRGKGSRYEWHVDSNPLTGILYVTTHDVDQGGELVFRCPTEQMIVHPREGIFIAFDARELPHTVMPLKTNSIRISVPMNYYDSPESQIRPSDLDEYLYDK